MANKRNDPAHLNIAKQAMEEMMHNRAPGQQGVPNITKLPKSPEYNPVPLQLTPEEIAKLGSMSQPK